MAGDEYVELPVELIHHIQSFLNPKQVVRTSVLSKVWYSAWSTIPILSLDYRNFYSSTRFTFENFARKDINRYQKLNLNINTFKLYMYRLFADDYDKFTRLGDELILSALALGVNDLHVNIRYASYTLPDQVFSSICLKKLYIDGGIINLPQSNGKSSLLCSRLVSLELSGVSMSDDMMRDVLLGSPLMEDLRIINCYDLKKINLSAVRCNLTNFQADSLSWQKLLVEWDEVDMQQQCHKLISLKLCEVKIDDLFFKFFSHRFPCLERLELEKCQWSVINTDIASNSLKYLSLNTINGLRFTKDQVPNVRHRYHNLISLELCEVEVDDLFFKFFSHRFPCLERLELESLKPEDSVINIDITSNSLQYLSVKWICGLRFITVQVPNIQNFRLVTSLNEGIPSLSFTTVSREWSSDLRFHHLPGNDRDANVSWWLKIRNILRELNYSKISIAIESLSNDQLGSISEEIIQSNHISPVVENLMIETRERDQNSFGWLLCCRPKYINWTFNYIPKRVYNEFPYLEQHGNYSSFSDFDLLLSFREKNLLQLIYHELKKHENKNVSYPMHCIHGLDKVDMEHYDETLREWRPVRPSQLQLRIAHVEGKFRLRLKWTNKRLTGGFQECCHGIVYFIKLAGTRVKEITSSLPLPFFSEQVG